jgi:hypothetical protein
VKTHDPGYNEQSMGGTEKLMGTEAEEIRAKLPCVSLSIRNSGQVRAIFRGLLANIASKSSVTLSDEPQWNVRDLLVVYFTVLSQDCNYRKSVKLTFQHVITNKSFDDKQISLLLIT